MTLPKSEPIAIIGGGAFGLSTALELSRNGYTNITVFEKDEEIPSRWSAANDLNKIARAEYEDDWYTNLAIVCFAPDVFLNQRAPKLTKNTRKRWKNGKHLSMPPTSTALAS